MFERFSKNARMVVAMAQEDARELRSPHIRVEHVLLGLLSQSEPELVALLEQAGLTRDGVRGTLAERGKHAPLGSEDADALRSIGIDLDAVRDSLEASFGADALDRATPPQRRGLFGWGKSLNSGHIPFTGDAKKVLELSLREALARKDKTIESAHVLLGILRAPNATTSALLGDAAGIAVLRERVHGLLDRVA